MSNLTNRQHLFFISKSENKNQVHYVISLDSNCQPIGNTPVSAYWQMLEKGTSVTEDLLPREKRAYGISDQYIKDGMVHFLLYSMPHKWITIDLPDKNKACQVKAITYLNGQQAILEHVYVDLWLFGIKNITIHGRSLKDNSKVEEVVK